jgi:flagellar hook-associated protein 2
VVTTSSSSIGLGSGQLNVGTAGTPTTITGLTTNGINTQAIENALIAAYSIPETQLQTEQTAVQTQISDYQTINTAFAALQASAESLATASGWSASTVTSSAASVASATATAGASAGSISFTVNALAQAGVTASSNQVSSTATVVATNPLFIATGASKLGFASLASTTSSLGTHSVAITQSSTAASASGFPVGSSMTFNTAATLTMTVDGNPETVTVGPGTYTVSQLASAVSSQTNGAASLSAGSDGSLTLSTTDEGSAASLQITGGTALTQLGLSATGALTGTDAIATVDGQATTISHVVAGQSLTLTGPNGTFTATPSSGHLSVGSVTGQEISVGSGTLAGVVAAINSAKAGITAAAVSTGSGYRLLLSASATGAGSDPSIDGSAFTNLGTMTTVTAGQDASVQVGGSTGFTVTSSTNQLSSLLPGVSVALQAVSATPVTLTITADAATAATNVSNLVDAANSALTAITTYAGYNAATQTGGPLMGDTNLSTLTQQVLSSVATMLGTSTAGGAGGLGLTLNADGSLSFDSAAFQTAYAADPSGVAAAFTQGGSLSASSPAYSGAATLVFAGNGAQAGNYDVTITHSATQGVATGALVTGGTVPAGGDALTVSVAGVSATYSASAGQSLSDVASGLNTAFASAGLSVTASVVTNGSDSQLVLTGSQYGATAGLSVSSTTGALGISSGSYNGTDVAGTINGVAGTGAGQFLQASSSQSSLGGLELKITASGITSATDIGTFGYTPGLSQQLASIAATATDPSTGSLTTTVAGLNTQISGLGDQITNYQALVAQETTMLTQQFSAMETQLSTLNATTEFLTQYLDAQNKPTA